MRKPLAGIAFLALASVAMAADVKEVKIPIKQVKLKNGLTVLLSEDHAAPTYSIAVTYNLTRYYVALPRRYPHATIHPRGRWQRAAGTGSGDPDFDRAFTVSPADEPATLSVLTPALRAALVAGQIQPFQLAGDLLVLSYHRAPTVDNLDPPLEMAVAIARLLPQ